MPYICLANANVPNGVLQITDLWPNESQKNNSIDPPGQTRYVNRPVTDLLGLSGTGPIVVTGRQESAAQFVLSGLAAYLADRIDPGGSQAATGSVTAVGPLVGDTLRLTGPDGVLTQDFMAVENTATSTITVGTPVAGAAQLTIGGVAFACVEDAATGTVLIKVGCAAGDIVTIAGVPFTAVNGVPVAANQEFQDVAGSGSAILTAASLVAAINDAASQALLTVALDALVAVPTAGTLTGANGGTATVTLTPSVPGVWGDATLAENTATVRVAVSGAAMTHTDPVAANQEFGSAAHYSGSANATGDVVASLVATINDPATVLLLDAANAGPVPTADFGHVVAVDANPAVGLTASQPGFSGKLSLATAQALELAIPGAELTLVQANPAAFEFDSLINSTAGTNATVAASIRAMFNDAATDAVLAAIGGCSITAAAPVGGLVGLTADTAGATGAMALTAPVGAARLTIAANSLGKTMVTWTATRLNACATAIQALVDAGSACTTAGINGACNGVAGVSGISVGASATEDILSILAGRVYQLPVGVTKDPTGKNWDTTAQGSFTTPNTVFDTDMVDGEWRPANRWVKHGKTVTGGDTVNNEIGGIRLTVDSAHFQASITTGQLAHYASGTVDLFPDAAVRTHISNWTRGTNRQAPLANQRIITVYDDTGVVLV